MRSLSQRAPLSNPPYTHGRSKCNSPTLPHGPPRVCLPHNERHEFGLLFAALVAESAGCKVIYLGVDLPVEEMIHAVKKTQSKGLALSRVTLPESICTKTLTTLRERLPSDVAVIAGGPKVQAIENIPGVEKIGSLERFVQRIRLMPRPAF